jgi:hypothetical protein
MLKKARILRFKERKMISVIREIVMYAMFVWVVLLIAYGHKDPNAHALNQGIKNMLTGTGNSWLVDYQPKKTKNGTKRKFLKVQKKNQQQQQSTTTINNNNNQSARYIDVNASKRVLALLCPRVLPIFTRNQFRLHAIRQLQKRLFIF